MASSSELPERTYSVSELGDELKLFVGEAFASIWVAGEVQRMNRSRRGHLYFELVEKGEGDEIVGKLDGVLWRDDHRRVRRRLAESDQELAAGMEIRCRGSVDFYPPRGRLQFIAREVDPLFSLGGLERRRRETLAALAEAELLDRNRRLPLPRLPLVVGLVTSEGSAAYHDFVTTLAESGYGFEILLVHAAVQGTAAEREVVTALAALADLPVDCLVVVRGGGSRTDLAAFDSRAIGEAIARSPLPVMTGIGHEVDRSVADRVAHTALKTPTQVASFLVERTAGAERDVRDLAERFAQRSAARLQASREVLTRAEQRTIAAVRLVRRAEEQLAAAADLVIRLARQRVRGARGEIEPLSWRLTVAAPRSLARRRHRYRRLGDRLARSAKSRVREARSVCRSHERLCSELAPERTLARGFSITRDPTGEPVREPAALAVGDRVRTEVAAGTFTSTVEER